MGNSIATPEDEHKPAELALGDKLDVDVITVEPVTAKGTDEHGNEWEWKVRRLDPANPDSDWVEMWGCGTSPRGGYWQLHWVRDFRVPLKAIGALADKTGCQPKARRVYELRQEDDGWLSETFGRIKGKEMDKYWYSPCHGIRFRSAREVSRFKYFMYVTGRDEADAWVRLQEIGGIGKWAYWKPVVETEPGVIASDCPLCGRKEHKAFECPLRRLRRARCVNVGYREHLVKIDHRARYHANNGDDDDVSTVIL